MRFLCSPCPSLPSQQTSAQPACVCLSFLRTCTRACINPIMNNQLSDWNTTYEHFHYGIRGRGGVTRSLNFIMINIRKSFVHVLPLLLHIVLHSHSNDFIIILIGIRLCDEFFSILFCWCCCVSFDRQSI